MGRFAPGDFPEYDFESAQLFEESWKGSGVVMLSSLHVAEGDGPLFLPELCTFPGIMGLDVLSFLGPAAVSIEEDQEFQPRDPCISITGVDGGPSSFGNELVDIDTEVVTMRKSVRSCNGRRH